MANASDAPRPKQHAVTYFSALQYLASDVKRARLESVTGSNGTVLVSLRFVTPAEAGSAAMPMAGVTTVPEAPLQRECGNGVKGSWYGYFRFSGQTAQVLLDAQKKVPLKSVVWSSKSSDTIEETFSNYVEVAPGHYAPQSVMVKNGRRQFNWRFKVHQGGLWLLDQSEYQGKKVAWVDQVLLNRPLASSY